MKYIDAERLRAEIKRQIRFEELNFAALGGGGQTFCINTLEWVLKRIDSLQQEQPEVELEKVVRIDNLIMTMLGEGYNSGYKTRPFYEEVLRRLNERKEDK